VIGLFAVCLLALGFSAKLRALTSLEFFAAGRNLTLPSFVAALVSTWYGGVLGIGESVTYFGLGTWLLFGVPYYVFGVLYGIYLAPKVRGAEQLSIPERFERTYGKPAALIAAILIFLLAIPAAHVLMLGTLTQMLTGWSTLMSLAVGAGLGTIFLYKGGLLADVRVALLAFVMMYLGFAVILAFSFQLGPPWEVWKSKVDPSLLKLDGGAGVVNIVGFFLLGAWTMVDPGFHQRCSGAASPSVARKGVLISVGFWFLFDALTVSTGLYALASLREPLENPIQTFPVYANAMLPPGWKALFLCGLIGTIVSALVGYTLVGGATLGREVLGRLRTGSEAQIVWWSRAGIAITLLLAVPLASFIPSVVNLWYQWGGCITGALLIPVIAAYRPRSALPGPWVAASAGLGFALAVLWLVYGITHDNPMLEVSIGDRRVGIGTLVPALIVSALTLGFGALLAGRKPFVGANGDG
jgi:SSS family solute:Na+ symporter